MSFPEEWGPQGGDSAPTESRLVAVSPLSNESLLIRTLLARSCASAKLVRVQRVQSKRLWRAYANYRDDELVHSCAGGDVNEMLLFHGTGERSASEVLAHPQGLDPRFSHGGFYGQGIYLADEPSYPIGGRFAHRIAGSRGRRMELIVVRAALGTPQEMGQRITSETRAMRMPGVRVHEGDGGTSSAPRVLYDSVRAGPHRPFLSGQGENGCDASIIHVVYEARQLYPAYVVEIEMDVDPEVVAAIEQNTVPDPSTSTGPAPKRQRRAAPGAGSSSSAAPGAGSSSSAALTPAPPPPVPIIMAFPGLDEVIAALSVTANSQGRALQLERLAELCRDNVDACNRTVDGGALWHVIMSMSFELFNTDIQTNGSAALRRICSGTDAEVPQRRQAAADAGAIMAVVTGMQHHERAVRMQASGSAALCRICSGVDASVQQRRQTAADAGAITAVVAGMRVDTADAALQINGNSALDLICQGTDASAQQRKQAAADAGAITVILGGMRARAADVKVQAFGSDALISICTGSDASANRRKHAALDAGAAEALASAARAHPTKLGLIQSAQRVLGIPR